VATYGLYDKHVTPLPVPQAMVHELLTIDNNRVDLRELGNKVSLHPCTLRRERQPLTRHISDCEREPRAGTLSRAGLVLQSAHVQQLR
jgi:hypothetical protein